MRLLVVAAHPDDEVLGCGGTLARRSQEGHEVYVAILGEGVTSRHPAREQAPRAELDRLQAASRQAARELGVREVFPFGFPDNRLDSVALLEIVRPLERLVSELRPEMVLTHHVADLNVDHGITCRATLTATRPVPGCPVREVLAFETPSATGWSFGQLGPAFEPTVFVDIAATLERKLAALDAYASERRPFPHPRSPEALRALAASRGSAVGVAAAEAFVMVRALW
jgi:LmbE family N-acetylglucosaminyl deacetylase